MENRPIKFRAWDKENNKMVVPFGIWAIPQIIEEIKDQEIGNNLELMQFTGLTDKNGKEIYEGDIVAKEESVMSDTGEDKSDYIEKRIDKGYIYSDGKRGERRYGRQIIQVQWKEKSCGFEPFSDSEENCGHCGGGITSKGVEVIGNIYENPDLLN